MIYFIDGLSEKSKELWYEPIEWAIKYLGLLDAEKNIEFKWKKLIVSTYGLCWDNGETIKIQINKLERDYDDILLTIFHELVHAEQLLTGKLSYVNGKMVWKNKSSSENPWEEDAEKKSVQMLLRYVHSGTAML